MKRYLQMATVAALAAFGSASAFAQSDLKAKIPFAFATPGGGEMAAGEYLVTKLGNTSAIPTYRLLNLDTRRSVIALAGGSVKRPSADTNYNPELTFKCAGENCAISGIFHAGVATGNGIAVRLKNVDPTTQIAEITIPFAE